jgi:hypothetical protein
MTLRRRFLVERLKSEDELESVQTRRFNEFCNGTKEKQEKKEWFDEEYATVNEEKNCAREPAIQIQNRTRAAKHTAMNEYRQARRRKKHMFN